MLLDAIEQFCASHEHTISALEAISTFAVVLTSIWLANRADKTRLTAYIAKQVIIDHTTSERPEYVVALIANKGALPFYMSLSFLMWTRPYRKTAGWMLQYPLDYTAIDKRVPQQKYPVEVAPKAQHQFFIADISSFRQAMRQSLLAQSGYGRFMFPYTRITIQTEDGSLFRGGMSPEIRRELRIIRASAIRSG